MSGRLRNLLTIAAVLAAAMALSACGGDEGGGAEETAGSGSSETVDTIVIDNFEYEPVDAVVEAGSEITFDNRDTAGHTASSEAPGAFDTGNIPAGESAPVTIAEPGEYAYICEFHPFMEATLTAR